MEPAARLGDEQEALFYLANHVSNHGDNNILTRER